MAAVYFKRHRIALDVHRIVPGSTYTVNGCVTLCRPCHRLKPRSEQGHSDSHTFSIPGDLYDALRALARRNHRTIKAQFEVIIEQGLEREGFWPPPATDEG